MAYGQQLLVHRAGADPVQTLAAAQLIFARQACQRGDLQSCHWLRQCGRAYLSLIAPSDVDVTTLYDTLMAGIAEPPETGSITSDWYVQRCLTLAATEYFESNSMESNRGSDAEHHGAEHECAPERRKPRRQAETGLDKPQLRPACPVNTFDDRSQGGRVVRIIVTCPRCGHEYAVDRAEVISGVWRISTKMPIQHRKLATLKRN